MGGLQPVEQQRRQGRQAGARHLAVEMAEVALAAALDDHRRQAGREGLPCQTPVPHPGDQPVGRNGQAVLSHRLAEEGVQQVARAGAQAISPEQLGVDELPQLPGLGRRQVVNLLQPGMAARPGGRPLARRAAEGVAEHRPGRVPGPARHGGDEGRRQARQALPAATVDDHGRIGSLEEHRVAALAGEQPGRPAPAHPPGDFGVIGDIDALQSGPDAVAQRIELRQGDRLDRLAHRGQVQTQLRRRRHGVGPLVALAPVAMEVEEAGAPGVPGRLETGGSDGRVQPA